MPKASKPRKKYRPKVSGGGPISLIDINRILRPLERMLSQLRGGEITIQNDQPALTDWEGFLCPAVPAVQGWIECFERISTGERIQADWSGLRELAILIRDDQDLTEALLDKVDEEVSLCRAIMRHLTAKKLGSYMRTEMIALEQESLGVVPKRTLD